MAIRLEPTSRLSKRTRKHRLFNGLLSLAVASGAGLGGFLTLDRLELQRDGIPGADPIPAPTAAPSPTALPGRLSCFENDSSRGLEARFCNFLHSFVISRNNGHGAEEDLSPQARRQYLNGEGGLELYGQGSRKLILGRFLVGAPNGGQQKAILTLTSLAPDACPGKEHLLLGIGATKDSVRVLSVRFEPEPGASCAER